MITIYKQYLLLFFILKPQIFKWEMLFYAVKQANCTTTQYDHNYETKIKCAEIRLLQMVPMFLSLDEGIDCKLFLFPLSL